MNLDILAFLCALCVLVATPLFAQENIASENTVQENSQILQIATVARAPFIFIEQGKVASGFTFELWQKIAERLDLKYQFVEMDSFDQMLKQVRSNNMGLAAANISITAGREQYLDFSQPIYDSGLRILTRSEPQSLSIFNLIWESGTIQLIGIAAAILLLIAHIMWWLEGGKGHPYFRKSYAEGVWDAFWWSFIIVTMGGFENERPQKVLSRMLAIFWIIAGLFFISTFTAKITTTLTVGELNHSINGWKDLSKKKVGIATNTTMERFAQRKGLRYIAYGDFNESLQALEKGDVDAVIGDAPVAEYYAHHNDSGKIIVVGDVFAPDKIGFAFQQGSVLRESVNQTLLQLFEDGTYDEIKQKYFGQ